jgi:hypothetical protein
VGQFKLSKWAKSEYRNQSGSIPEHHNHRLTFEAFLGPASLPPVVAVGVQHREPLALFFEQSEGIVRLEVAVALTQGVHRFAAARKHLLISSTDLEVILVLSVSITVQAPHFHSNQSIDGLLKSVRDDGEPFHQRG